MEKLLEEKSSFFKMPKVGDIVEVRVISLGKNEAEVDIPGIGAGIVRGPEFYEPSEKKIKVDDKMKAMVLEIDNEEGKFELSFKRALEEEAWREISETVKKDKVIEVKITQANKGGLLTQIKGIPAFLPVSQLHHKHYPRVEGADRNRILAKLNKLVNQTLRVKIIDANEREERLIISEKEAGALEQKEIIKKLKVGEVVEGEITGVVHFGAFIRFNGLEGLIHISELDWQRIEDPRDIVKVGDRVKAKIISINSSRLSLSLKALKKDPWEVKTKKYKVGQIISGQVTKISPFGAFVQLDKDIHGLAHISEIVSADEKLGDILKVGEKRKFKILSIEPAEHRLGLSTRTEEKPQSKTKKKSRLGRKAKKTSKKIKKI